MDQLQVQALAALLHRALNSVLIRDHSRNQHMQRGHLSREPAAVLDGP